jgi:uncharacterized membrane protein
VFPSCRAAVSSFVAARDPAAAPGAAVVVDCIRDAPPLGYAAAASRATSIPAPVNPMQLGWLSLAVLCTVGYHLVLKLTPAGANPLLSLMVTYAVVTIAFGAVLLAAPGGFEWRHELRQLNWTALALALVIVGLDVAFLMTYRSGFEVSLGALVTQSAAAMLLLAIGVAVFREKLTVANATGLVLCLVGLWLVSRR